MHINHECFTPVASLLGGVLVGTSCAAYLLLAGRIAGISGVLTGALKAVSNGAADEDGLRRSFTAALILSGAVYAAAGGSTLVPAPLAVAPLILGGALVGLGAGMQHGCTSGHGVCGLARRSPKSFVLVCTFMVVGVLTATFARSALLTALPQTTLATTGVTSLATQLLIICLAALALATAFYSSRTAAARPTIGMVCGALFGAGMLVSGMAKPTKVIGFLDVLSPNGWDPSLAFVMLGAISVAMGPFYWAQKSPQLPTFCCESPSAVNEGLLQEEKEEERKVFMQAPLLFPETPFASLTFLQPASWMEFTQKKRSLVGSALFGAGWAVSGMCPGPALVLAGSGSLGALLFVLAVVGGLWCAQHISNS